VVVDPEDGGEIGGDSMSIAVAALDDQAPPGRARPQLVLQPAEDGQEGAVLEMPATRVTLRHAVPVVVEAVIGPLVIFYPLLMLTGLRGALVGALCWSYAALIRRLRRGEPASALLLLGTLLLTIRTVISLVTGSAFLYFAQPLVGTIAIAVVLLASAVAGRPFTQRFAHDFCPIDPAILARPRIHRFFRQISVLWAATLLINSGLVLWLLLSSSLHAFVLERTAVSWGLTAVAITLSILGFVATMRRDGVTVRWCSSRQDPPLGAPQLAVVVNN
jgi:hypothetical protein